MDLAININPQTEAQLQNYAQILISKNKEYNLCSRKIRNAAEFYQDHVVDALNAFPYFQKAIDEISKTMKTPIAKPISIADLGSGNGIPGLPLALCFPQLSCFLIDRHAKKAAFLNQLKQTMHLGNLTIICQNLKEISNLQRPIDIITARAFGSLDAIIQQSRGLRHGKTRFLVYKGRKAIIDEELQILHKKQSHSFRAQIHRLANSRSGAERHLVEIQLAGA